MCRYLLDTNTVSEIRRIKSGKANQGLADWACQTDARNFCISVITVLELEKGCLLKQRKDPKQAAALLAWLERQVLPDFDGRILPVTAEIARLCARLHVPDAQPAFDSLIAATALQHDLIVVTRNIKDFSQTGVRLFNPFI